MKNERIISIVIFLIVCVFSSNCYSQFMEVVKVSDAGMGEVNYEYYIGKYEVTNYQYAAMLNAVAKSDPFGLYNGIGYQGDGGMAGTYGGILRQGTEGNYSYLLKAGWENKPVIYVSRYDAARFVNWLNNGMTNDPNSTEYGAYDTSNFSGITHNSGATYWLPTEKEWEKAGYYDPTLNNGTGGYWTYPTMSKTPPTPSAPTNAPNSANYGWAVGNLTDVGAYAGSASAITT